MKRKAIAAIILATLFPCSALAVEAHHRPVATGTASSALLTEGEVRKVDKEAKKITIRHGPIVNLDMPAMTMVFQVKDPSMLDRVKAGDRIKFMADRIGGGYAVTQLEVAN